MKINKIHYLSGLIITVFVLLHLVNHTASLFGIDAHIAMMNKLRVFYRNIFVEAVLLSAVVVQIVSGIKLVQKNRKTDAAFFDKIHIWSGIYLAGFFLFHVGAVLSGRFVFNLDTNFYFGAAGLNTFPFNLFFIPYYTLAVISFFAHVASVHAKNMKQSVIGLVPRQQAMAILFAGVLLSVLLLYGLTNHFRGVEIPEAYNVLIGK